MPESRTIAILTGTVTSVVAAAVVAWAGIGSVIPSGVTIDGPTITTVEEPIRLEGHVNGNVRSAHWSDEIGTTQELGGTSGSIDWYCLGPGTFRVSLVAEMTDGSQVQATHEVQCV